MVARRHLVAPQGVENHSDPQRVAPGQTQTAAKAVKQVMLGGAGFKSGRPARTQSLRQAIKGAAIVVGAGLFTLWRARKVAS